MTEAYSGASGDVKRLFGRIAGRYDLTNTILSLGIHHYWRWYLMRSLPIGEEKRVLDVACGTGELTRRLQKRYRFTVGADFCEPMLRAGMNCRPSDELAPFLQADALRLPFGDGTFDILTVAFGVRNFENLVIGLRELRRVLAPGGTLAVLEFGQPKNALIALSYRLYSKCILPVIGGLITGDREAYRYLDDTAGRFPCGEAFVAHLNEAGFASVRMYPLTGGIAYLYLAQ